MRGALNKSFVYIKELIFLPFKTGSSVRAFVVICKKAAVFMYNKNRLGFTFNFNLEAFAAGVFDIRGFAEDVCHDV